MFSSRVSVRLRAAVAVGAVTALAAAGCSSSTSSKSSAKGNAPINIGLITALTGSNQALGPDHLNGFQLYLDTHNDMLGGHKVSLKVGDEANGGAAAVPVAKKMIEQDHVLAIAGIVATPTIQAVVPIATAAGVPVVNTGGRPTVKDVSHLWTMSFMSTDPGASMGPYMAQNVPGSVYAFGPDYQGGYDQLRGFTDAYTKAGGKLANDGGKATFTPFPNTTDFTPFLSKVKASGAKAIYCFYTGQNAIDFVKDWSQSDAKDIPLYAAGFITEGGALKAEGQAANGIITTMNYSPDISSAANRQFVSAWSQKYNGEAPPATAMYSWDAASVLDQAIAKAGPNPTPDAVNSAIKAMGQIDSPRGTWQLSADTHVPVQKWYLRKVEMDGTALANVKIGDLATIGS
ncbi:ABC transporter substrate-binding protein [Catenulispora sp. NL8]|uniref:ABC transporter substrate-binding protein n=1 Tax=Catenulispora pinistramenti TaxID=2705254 RepID=A0ABS5L531_9ACTN|nr:ABC transporter substrate-binding protein [Catenulispora pinistramenti]MBS2553460.1 ABC transporter substrate-binding protein [Catenulispora pinistramenti]